MVVNPQESMWSGKFLIYSNHCRKRTAHIWSQGKSVYLIVCLIACILNDFFVFQTELAGANTISPVISPYQTQQFLSSFIATEEQVLQLMRGVDTSKVYGYDGVGNRIIKMCSDGFMSISLVLSICLFHFFAEACKCYSYIQKWQPSTQNEFSKWFEPGGNM